MLKSTWNRICNLRCIYAFLFSVTLSHAANNRKSLNQEISTRKKNLDPQNNHKKISDLRNTHEKKFRSHKIPTKKNLGATKYPREKMLDPQNIHEGTMVRRHETHDMRPNKSSTFCWLLAKKCVINLLACRRCSKSLSSKMHQYKIKQK